MAKRERLSRRSFIRNTVGGTIALPLLGGLARYDAFGQGSNSRSKVFRVNNCPVHDGQLRHVGIDALLQLLSANGMEFYKSAHQSPSSAPTLGPDRR